MQRSVSRGLRFLSVLTGALLMAIAPAQAEVQPFPSSFAFRDLRTPLVNNFAAREIRTAAQARQGLLDQVPNPVRWEASIRYLAAQGVSHFVEVGPGRVLTGLLRNIDRSLQGSNVEDLKSLEKLLSAFIGVHRRFHL